MVNWSFTRMPNLCNGERGVFSGNGAGTTGYPYAKELSQTLISHHIQNLTWDGLKRAKTVRILEENLGINLCDLGLGGCFLNMTWKA